MERFKDLAISELILSSNCQQHQKICDENASKCDKITQYLTSIDELLHSIKQSVESVDEHLRLDLPHLIHSLESISVNLADVREDVLGLVQCLRTYETTLKSIDNLPPLCISAPSASCGQDSLGGADVDNLFLQVGDQCLAEWDGNYLWYPAKVLETRPNASLTYYFVIFNHSPTSCWLPSGKVAHSQPSKSICEVGCRVVVAFESIHKSSEICAAVIAEAPSIENQDRYLCFCDNGSCLYARKHNVFRILFKSSEIWHCISQESQCRFIQKYLSEFPFNKIINLNVGACIGVKYRGHILNATVIQCDASLVKLQFICGDKEHQEWIYRGSTRIQLPNKECKRKHLKAVSRHAPPTHYQTSPFNSRSPGYMKLLRQLGIFEENYVFGDDKIKRESHNQCDFNCVRHAETDLANLLKEKNFLSIPLFCKWQRQFGHCSVGKGSTLMEQRHVYYITPCGLRCRDLSEVHGYLLATRSDLTVDMFCFDDNIDVISGIKIAQDLQEAQEHGYSIYTLHSSDDVSKGMEYVKVPVVNCINDKSVADFQYEVTRCFNSDIQDVEKIVSCCECKDNCINSLECACQKLTMKHSQLMSSNDVADPNYLYQYRRLASGQQVKSGIWECNDRCSCNSSCLNRVAQRPLHYGLQVFMTSNKNWGVRSLFDIPKGSFICLYNGEIESKMVDDSNSEYCLSLNFAQIFESILDDKCEQTKFADDLKRNGKPASDVQSASSADADLYPGNWKQCEWYMIDAKTKGNVGRFLNHSCRPNAFVQTVFIDTHDFRLPWVALFASENIRRGTEICWNYNFEYLSSRPPVYCRCGEKGCIVRLM